MTNKNELNELVSNKDSDLYKGTSERGRLE